MQPRYAFGSLLIVGALGFLVANSMRAGAVQSIPVGDLCAQRSKGESFVGRRLRVVGFVGKMDAHPKEIQTSNGTIKQVSFEVVEGKNSLPVVYSDVLPDTFRVGGPVQIDGVYTAAGKIEADHVLTKCPSKYQAGEKAANLTAQAVKS